MMKRPESGSGGGCRRPGRRPSSRSAAWRARPGLRAPRRRRPRTRRRQRRHCRKDMPAGEVGIGPRLPLKGRWSLLGWLSQSFIFHQDAPENAPPCIGHITTIVIPAKAGTHSSSISTADKWVPAFSHGTSRGLKAYGMTAELIGSQPSGLPSTRERGPRIGKRGVDLDAEPRPVDEADRDAHPGFERAQLLEPLALFENAARQGDKPVERGAAKA